MTLEESIVGILSDPVRHRAVHALLAMNGHDGFLKINEYAEITNILSKAYDVANGMDNPDNASIIDLMYADMLAKVHELSAPL